MNGSTPAHVYDICERLRRSIEEYDWSSVAQGLEVTASLGVAHCGAGKSPAEIFAKADNRLFYAKAKGRNRVVTCIYPSERSQPDLKVVS